MRFGRHRLERDVLTQLRRLAHLDAGDELGRLALDLGGAEDVSLGTDFLDHLDVRGDAL